MRTKHTKGPWITGFSGAAVFTKTKKLIATIADREDQREKKANAILISLAPDLLDALVKANKHIETYCMDENVPPQQYGHEALKKIQEG
jgi:hypothetical protein